MRYATAFATALAISTMSSHASAQVATDGAPRELRLLVSHAAGGGFDTYARLYGRHVGRHLPGEPNVVVQNMPGAAGVVMTNHLAAQAPRDGSVIGLAPGSIATAALFGSRGARYRAADLTWIGSLNNEVAVAVSRADAPVRTASDLFKEEWVVGGVGASDNSVIFANLLTRVLGARIRLIAGYKGSTETALAMERGETQGVAGWSYSSLITMKPDWVREKKVNILVQFTSEPHPDLPHVPTVTSLASNDQQRALLDLIFTQTGIGRVIVAPPELTRAATELHREAFRKTISDPAFKADAERGGIELNGPRDGVAVEELVRRLHTTPEDLLREAASAVGSS